MAWLEAGPCDTPVMLRRGAVVLVLVAGCGKPADDCERAIRRLGRLSEAKGHSLPDRAAEDMMEVCRTGKYAAYDPVLRCAMDSRSDAAAAECIDRGLKDVLHISNDGSGGGAGLNPLLHE